MLTKLPNRVSALFADPIHTMFRDLDRTLSGQAACSANGSRKVAPLSVWSEGNDVFIEADVPGITPDNLDVSLEHGQLTIRGKRVSAERSAENLHEERFFGEFERHVALGESMDPDSIQARLQDGVLSVKASKKLEAQRQKVAIQYGGEQVQNIAPAE